MGLRPRKARHTTVDLFGPDAFSIENGKKDGVYHLRHFESVEALSHRIVIQHPST